MSFYDKFGRTLLQKTEHPYSGADVTRTRYHFDGRELVRYREHIAMMGGSTRNKALYGFTYDNMNRLIQAKYAEYTSSYTKFDRYNETLTYNQNGDMVCHTVDIFAKCPILCDMRDRFPILRTDRLLLRQITDADLENIFNGLSHPDVVRYYGVSYSTMESAKDQMRFYADLERNQTGIWWAVCSPGNDIFYGAGGLNSLNRAHKKTEIGFWLLPRYWGKGIMSEALPLICNYAFKALGLHRIEGFVETGNTSCRKALEKLKFHHEGTMRDCEIKNGKYISLDVYARFEDDGGK